MKRKLTPVTVNDKSDFIKDCDVLWHLVEEQLFRSVEGQAASDEEEDKWTGDQQRQVNEVKRILTRLSCCGERYYTFIFTGHLLHPLLFGIGHELYVKPKH